MMNSKESKMNKEMNDLGNFKSIHTKHALNSSKS